MEDPNKHRRKTLKENRKLIRNNHISPPHSFASKNHLGGRRVLDTMLRPSGRGELEITVVDNEYIRRGRMEYKVLDGNWMYAFSPSPG